MTTQMTDDQAETAAILAEQSERLFARAVTPETLTAADGGAWQGQVWAAVEEAGLPLALLAEEAGGIGLAPVEAFRLVRLAAFHAAPAPLGETMVALALWGAPLEGPVTLAPRGLDAAAGLGRLAWGREAGHVLAHAGEDRLALIPLSGLALRRGRNVANEPRDELAGPVPEGAEIRRHPGLGPDGLAPYGALLRSAQMCGAMRRAMELSLAYAAERRQFGRPIAKFQAVQHMLAEAAGHLAAAVAIADTAAEAWGRPDFGFVSGLAKARVGEAAGKVAAIAHQVHAAMGFTQEHPLHHSTRRLWAWRDEFGAETWWQERIGRAVCAEGGEALWDRVLQVTSGRAA